MGLDGGEHAQCSTDAHRGGELGLDACAALAVDAQIHAREYGHRSADTHRARPGPLAAGARLRRRTHPPQRGCPGPRRNRASHQPAQAVAACGHPLREAGGTLLRHSAARRDPHLTEAGWLAVPGHPCASPRPRHRCAGGQAARGSSRGGIRPSAPRPRHTAECTSYRRTSCLVCRGGSWLSLQTILDYESPACYKETYAQEAALAA